MARTRARASLAGILASVAVAGAAVGVAGVAFAAPTPTPAPVKPRATTTTAPSTAPSATPRTPSPTPTRQVDPRQLAHELGIEDGQLREILSLAPAMTPGPDLRKRQSDYLAARLGLSSERIEAAIIKLGGELAPQPKPL